MKRNRRWFIAPCALDCYYCPIRLRTEEELDYWRRQNVDTEKIRCDGCRSDRVGDHWAPECKILQCCIYEKKLEFCAQCADLPCDSLEEWGKEYEHHAKVVERLNEMKKTGVELWLQRYLEEQG